jgi:hypothetical protein
MSRAVRWLAALLVAGSGRFAGAQSVRGTVRDSASQQPIAGAVVVATDARGQTVARGITNDRGQFRFSTRENARQLSVKRIGFHPRNVPVPSDTATVDVALVPLPSLLEPIQVSDVTKCPKRSDRTVALSLWEQARTALLAAVVGRETNPANMRRLLFDRVVDRSGKPLSQSVRIDSARTDRAFGAALSVAEFLSKGFKGDSGGMDVFYGPDADILLSDEFAAGYCFRIADRDASRSGQIGLAFAPAERSRDRTDIEGTLWIDSVARRIVDIDYAYLGLEPRVLALKPGGRSSFRTMGNGLVLLDHWFIRLVGAAADSTTTFRGRTAERVPTLQVREIGGEIARAKWPDGYRWNAPLGIVRGHATRDGAPAAGMTVRLEQTDYAAVTDSGGGFQIAELLPGPYVVGVEDERLERVGLTLPSGVSFTALRESMAVVATPIPSLEDYAWGVCRNDPKRSRAGRPAIRMLIVRLTDRDGRPVVGAKATVKVQRTRETISSSDVESGAGGRFEVCGLAETATDVTVFVERSGLPPYEFGSRLTGVLTTASVVLPTMGAPSSRPR